MTTNINHARVLQGSIRPLLASQCFCCLMLAGSCLQHQDPRECVRDYAELSLLPSAYLMFWKVLIAATSKNRHRAATASPLFGM